METCEDCGIERPKLHRHHVVARSLGGSDDPSNIVNICANCHQDRHSTEEGRLPWRNGQTPEHNAARSRRMKEVWEDPAYREQVMATREKTWTPERYAARAEKIKEAYQKPENRRKQAEKAALFPAGSEKALARGRKVAEAIARKTPEERAEHARKISEAKKGKTLGRWARDYNACQTCGTTEVKHHSKGDCRNCYQRKRRASDPA